jgi:hypothetical protein
MSDFKFACPGCGQRIAASDDYTGYQINCPACQAPIVVPANPAAPDAPPARSGVAMAAPQAHTPAPGAASAPQMDGSAAYRAHLSRKPKKSYTGLITAAVVVVLLGGSAFLNRDWIAGKWKAMRGPSAAQLAAQAAAQEATNTPPPQPELTASEVMQKMIETYKDLPTFNSTGKITAILDMSAVSPALAAAGPQTNGGALTLRMGKPLSFRIAMTTPAAQGGMSMTGWSTGNGDFLQLDNSPVKVQSHEEIFVVFNLGASAGVGDLVRLFINDTTKGFAKEGVEWTRNDDQTISGQPCYVLAGTVNLQNVIIWVSRRTFLITQMQAVLDGKSGMAAMDDADIKTTWKAMNNGKEPTLAQVANFKKMAKVTGTVTATYDDIKTNLTLAARDFQPGAAGPAAPAQPGGRQAGRGAPGGRATAIANGRRRGNQPGNGP